MAKRFGYRLRRLNTEIYLEGVAILYGENTFRIVVGNQYGAWDDTPRYPKPLEKRHDCSGSRRTTVIKAVVYSDYQQYVGMSQDHDLFHSDMKTARKAIEILSLFNQLKITVLTGEKYWEKGSSSDHGPAYDCGGPREGTTTTTKTAYQASSADKTTAWSYREPRNLRGYKRRRLSETAGLSIFTVISGLTVRPLKRARIVYRRITLAIRENTAGRKKVRRKFRWITDADGFQTKVPVTLDDGSDVSSRASGPPRLSIRATQAEQGPQYVVRTLDNDAVSQPDSELVSAESFDWAEDVANFETASVSASSTEADSSTKAAETGSAKVKEVETVWDV
ncbi:hypothetical protein QBC47DRAFT_462947 [Echria macrotheca]|uniref:Uncharacterized protein n=1 Tax=Echria macrotheca TaxID=438768 RepID=A0AAJ0BAV4_9PEZI|nr:hypothetical protein QBC47DRAFT_462947 [Echria macrotheca]